MFNVFKIKMVVFTAILVLMIVLAAVLALAWPAAVHGQEAIALATPIPAINSYVPESLTITLEPVAVIRVTLLHKGSGRSETFIYPCSSCAFETEADVRKMIATLNTANLSTRSLWRRIMDRLILDFPGRLVGAVVQ